MAPQKMMVPASEVMSVTHRHSSSKSRGDAAPAMLSIRQEPGVSAPDGVPVVIVALAPGVPPPPDKGCPPVECVFPGVPVVFVTVGLEVEVEVGVELPGVSVGCGVPVVTVGDGATVAVMGGVATGVEVTVGVTMGVGVTGMAVGVITGVGVVGTGVGMTVGVTGRVGVATGVFATPGEGVGRRTGGFVPTGVGVGCR